MAVIRYLLAGLWLSVVTVGQAKTTPQKPPFTGPGAGSAATSPASGATKIPRVKYDGRGWPVGINQSNAATSARVTSKAASRPTPQEPLKTRQSPSKKATGAENAKDILVAAASEDNPLASGMQLDSPMHEIFRATRSPGALRAMGGVEVWWRLTIHGTHGEVIGIREITQTADCSFAARDRLEFKDSRIFARIGRNVTAQKGGIPWASLSDDASIQLELFGMHLRLPWSFGEGKRYAIVRREVAARRGEDLVKLKLQQRPSPSTDIFGPNANPIARDKFELLYEPSTGLPREFVHQFAATGQRRRVLLEEWKEQYGVRMPWRRIYVDDAGRPTTTMEILEIKKRRVSERDFRLL
jgi:hypothetical protein